MGELVELWLQNNLRIIETFRLTGTSIQEPLLDWKIVCYKMAIAKSEGDLWIISQIGRSSEIRLSPSPPPPGLI